MKKSYCAAALLASVTLSHATIYVGPFVPIFKGIQHAVGTNTPTTTVVNNGVQITDSTLQVVHCVKIDLSDPGVKLLATPAASSYVANSRETLSLSVPDFLRNNGLQVAADANFYSANPGGSDPSSEGVPSNVDGLLISTGRVVSAADSTRTASLLFTTNKTPIIALNNGAPGTNTTGIYNAVTGYYPVLTNGVNVWAVYNAAFNSAYPDSFIHQTQPRTAFGISQDRRYLFMMTIDGRQSGYSDGALDAETAMWLLQFGAWDGINMDGGGSTAMYMADCSGNPVGLNHSSLLVAIGRERYIGAHFGVYADALDSYITQVSVAPGVTDATVTWTTTTPSSSQVEYGLSQSYGTLSPLDSTMVTSHSVTLTGLSAGTRYYYRALSSDGVTQYSTPCPKSFVTTNNGVVKLLYDLTNSWKFSTGNLDGTNWQASGYNDSGWSGPGPGMLWADSRVSPNPNGVILENTQLPLNPANSGFPFITYYFRTHFNFIGSPSGVSLTFSNYIDDGAAFYLNGVEINRAYLPNPAFNSTTATGVNCPATGDATCPYVFTLSGSQAASLVSGDNVVAVEVHNKVFNSPDITFGQALLALVPPSGPPPVPFLTNVVVTPGETSATISWTTLSNANSQVKYGLTAGLGNSTPIDPTLVTNHSLTITGLQQLTKYYFQAVSTFGGVQYTSSGTFITVPFGVELVSMTDIWSYDTNNLSGTNWTAPTYDESLFIGQGPALLYIETSPLVAPLNTPVYPTNGGLPFPTYYFRTHFVFDTNLAGLSLMFSNYIDDGAIFYLNGTEVQRVRMDPGPQPVPYTALANGCPNSGVDCHADTNAPDVFRISGSLMTNLIQGADNVLAAEVHQRSASSSNIVFGSAVSLVRALVSETIVRISRSGNTTTVAWDGTGFTLQRANTLTGTNAWTDVPGPVKTSPYVATNPPAYFRLRQ